MKWPNSLRLIRHGQSEYNALRIRKEQDPLYQRFKALYDATDANQSELIALAHQIKEKYALGVGDHATPLTPEGRRQARITGEKLLRTGAVVPDVVIYSPYARITETLEVLASSWTPLKNVRWVEDDRTREQDHGLATLYNDWRIFNILHPEQRELRALQGNYWYQYPQGESVAQVRDRGRSIQTTLIREYSRKDVVIVTHHLTILSIRANIERLTPEEFIRLDEEDKPVNCGVTEYVGRPDHGRDGKLFLETYNQRLY